MHAWVNELKEIYKILCVQTYTHISSVNKSSLKNIRPSQYYLQLNKVTPLKNNIAQRYRVRINYRRGLQNHNFTNTEQKYMTLLPFERGMFAVS